MVSPAFPDLVAKAEPPSDQAAHATPRLHLQLGPQLRPRGFPQRRSVSLLRILPDDAMHDSPLYGPAVHVVRVVIESHESHRPLRPIHALLCRRTSWRSCSGYHYAFGRDQDTTADTRKCDRRRAKKCVWAVECSENNTPKRWIWRFLPWIEATNHHDDAQHCHLLVGIPLPASLILQLTGATGLHTRWQKRSLLPEATEQRLRK
jgi:hypothetical protein